MSSLNISVNDLPVSESNFTPVPAGWYTASITGAEVKDTKTGGQMIAIKYSIIAPTHQGRIIFGNLNIKNQNPEAERIGRQQLGDLMRSIGLVQLRETDQLIGTNLQIKLKIRPAKGDYDESNDVSGFKVVTGFMPPVASDNPFANTSQATSAPPWAKK